VPESDARERILEAACDLVAAEGIDNVRIARVAMRAGASTALVHHYFSTREELLEQALLHSFEVVADGRFAAEAGGGDSATAALAAAIEECLPIPGRLERDWVLWVELWLRAAREPELRPLAAKLYSQYHEWLAAVLRAGVESGEFRAPADLDVLTDRAMAMLDGLGLRALLRDPTMDIEAARRQVAELLAAELGIDAGTLAPSGSPG
jgi:AcrR family transcriptional regulator